MKKLQIALLYYSLFLLAFGILLFARPISAEETDIKVPTLAEGLDRKELSSRIEEDEKEARSKWLSWFEKENLSVRTSFFGGRIRHDTGHYFAGEFNDTVHDPFILGGKTFWGGEFGIGYKMQYGIELGVSYMFMELNDWDGRVTDVLQNQTPPEWYQRANMDLDSRAAMFNVRAYLDDLTGIEMGRFSPYILGSVGQARHRVSDHRFEDETGALNIFYFETKNLSDANPQFAYRAGLGTLFRLTDHFKIDASASLMDWGEARGSHEFTGTAQGVDGKPRAYKSPPAIDVRAVQGTIGIQFNF